MSKKKILLNASMYSKNPSGVGIYIREVYNRLSEQLSERTLHYRCYTYSDEGMKEKRALHVITLPFFLEFLFKSFVPLHRIIWNIFFLPFVAKKYDIVYSFSSHGSPFIKNQIITIHDLICLDYPHQNKFQYLYFKFLLPYIIRASKKIIVISDFTREAVIERYKVNPDKVIVIHNGGDHLNDPDIIISAHDVEKLESIAGNKPFFLTVGASLGHKNVDKIIEAMKNFPKYFLIVTGPQNSYFEQLKKTTVKADLKNIIFTDYVPSSLLKLMYKKCVANIYISSHEGFGFPPLEAAVNNKVSIVANQGVLPEIYGDAVYYVNPVNVEEIKNAISVVTSSDFNINEYKNKFAQLIRKYGWHDTTYKIMNLILEITGRKLLKTHYENATDLINQKVIE